MTRTEARKTLVEAFQALPKRDRDRLLFHAEKKTAICCGSGAKWFIDQRGAG